MNQMSMFFGEPPRIPDAIVNGCGIMVGHVLSHLYGIKDRKMTCTWLEFRFGHVCGRWAFSIQLKTSTTYSGYLPNIKHTEFDTFEEARQAAIEGAMWRLNGLAKYVDDDGVSKAAKYLIRLIEADDYKETEVGDD